MPNTKLNKISLENAPLEEAINVNKSQKIFQVINIMQERSLDRVIVNLNGKPKGVITSKDILFKLEVKKTKKPTSTSMSATGFVSSSFISVKFNKTVRDAAKIISENKISAVPILNEDGISKKIISRKTIIELLKENHDVTVKEIIQDSKSTANASARLIDVLSRIRGEENKTLIVLENLRNIGIINERGIVSKLFKAIIPDSLRNIDVVLNKLLVYDAMVKLRIQINSKTSLKEAIDIMQNEELFTLPIVENGKIMGVITEETVFEYMLANE